MPMADSVLIFDEVKVISRLMWNSRSQTIVGLAMTADDQASLHDVYQLFDKDKAADQTAYILQFLWRDLTSSYDIVGPFYTNSETFSAKTIHACVFETIHLFQVIIEIYFLLYEFCIHAGTWIYHQSPCMRWCCTQLDCGQKHTWLQWSIWH